MVLWSVHSRSEWLPIILKKVLKCCQEINWLLQFPDCSQSSTELKFSASKKQRNAHHPKWREAGSSFLTLSVSALGDCNRFLGARGGPSPEGIANSSTFGWMNLPLGLTPFPPAMEKARKVPQTNIRVELIISKCTRLTVSVRWGDVTSLSALIFLGHSGSRYPTFHQFAAEQSSSSATCRTGNK